MFTNYVHQLTMHCKKYISTHFSMVVIPLFNQPNSDLISNNINAHGSFDILFAPDLNTSIFPS